MDERGKGKEDNIEPLSRKERKGFFYCLFLIGTDDQKKYNALRAGISFVPVFYGGKQNFAVLAS